MFCFVGRVAVAEVAEPPAWRNVIAVESELTGASESSWNGLGGGTASRNPGS